MKIKPGFKIRKMCGSAVVVAVGKQGEEFNGMITLNESGELLWEELCKGADITDLVQLLMNEYGIDENTATQDVEAFVERIKGEDLFE